MSKQTKKRQILLLIELGYKLEMHTEYFESIKDETIEADYWSKLVRYAKDQIEIINEYEIFLFGNALDRLSENESQETLRDYFSTIFRKTKAKIHIHFGGSMEAGFDLGALFASNVFQPPKKPTDKTFLREIREKLDILGIKVDDTLQKELPKLFSEEFETRNNVRKDIFKRIENVYGEKVTTSWWTGFEITVEIPGIAKFKKELK